MHYHFLLQRIFPTQGSNPRLLHWQADSLPLNHQRKAVKHSCYWSWFEGYPIHVWGFPSGACIKNPPAMQEMRVWPLGQEAPLEKGMATHSSILAWWSHGQRSLEGYSPWRHKESDTTEAAEHSCSMHNISGQSRDLQPAASFILCPHINHNQTAWSFYLHCGFKPINCPVQFVLHFLLNFQWILRAQPSVNSFSLCTVTLIISISTLTNILG